MSQHTNIRCGNCGKQGHIYKDCVLPTMSMGIICCKMQSHNVNDLLTKSFHTTPPMSSPTLSTSSHLTHPTHPPLPTPPNIRYLLICRKYTMAFVEFIRGKYEITKPVYITKLMERMTFEELMKISKNTYDELYKNLWQNNYDNHHHYNEYVKANAKFLTLTNGYTYKDNKYNLQYFVNSVEKAWKEPEWGFPKGRRNNNEPDLKCAIREFSEETNLTDKDYSLINLDPIDETYTSLNKIRYKHIYYLAQASKTAKAAELTISPDNKYQAVEVGDIGWFTYEEALEKIRDYQTEKKQVLEKVHKTLINLVRVSETTASLATAPTTSASASTSPRASPTSTSPSAPA